MFTEARLTGDLVLEYADLGDPGGLPVVLQPGSPSTAGVGALLDETARRHGLRLVAVSRPGYGASTPTPPGLASVGRQVVELADLLGLARFGTFGSSGGGPYALATAAVAPERVTRVVIAAGAGLPEEGQEEETEASVMEEVRAFTDPLRALDADGFRAAMSAGTPANETYFDTRPEGATFFADLRRALELPDGLARDNLSWGVPWDIDVASVTTPVDLFYGEVDQMVPARHGQHLAGLLPHATLTVLPGAGHGITTFGVMDRLLALFVDRPDGLAEHA